MAAPVDWRSVDRTRIDRTHPANIPGHGGSSTSRRRRDGGFTLVELLVVLVILALLAGLVAPRVMGYLGGARQQTAAMQIDNLSTALDLYRLDVGRYPSAEEGLAALVDAPAAAGRWRGPYLSGRTIPVDPWGNPYQYAAPGAHGDFDLLSFGADGRPGGDGDDADITNW